jgi:hypothetical protein
MVEQKTCEHCGSGFEVADWDLDFMKRISPTFAGKTFEMPGPKLCVECREIRRNLLRNERNLYRRKSDKSGQDIISAYSPDKELVVYSSDEWWGDSWDGLDYGIDFDPKRNFFDQYMELYKKVPKLALSNTNNENTEFGNFIDGVKDCYMSFICYFGGEKVLYTYVSYTDRNCMDNTFSEKNENCYWLYNSTRNFGCSFCDNIHNSRDCRFSYDLIGCSDCIFSSNLRRKQFCIENKQYSKEEYLKKIKEYDFGSYEKTEEYKKKLEEIKKNSIVKFANIVNCEDSVGDDLVNCKNAVKCYGCNNVENGKYTYRAVNAKDAMDFMGGGFERGYEVSNVGNAGVGYYFCEHCLYCNNVYYCRHCFNSSDCFGCVGLIRKQYCILNKQFSKEEYEKKVAEIIEKMQETGEWGDLFPIKDNVYAYNETLANDNFPKTKEEAIAFGCKWQDNDFSLQHDGPFYEPKDNIKDYVEDEAERQMLLSGILKCELSGKPFKIMPQELAFYMENNLPVTRKHFNIRFKERFSKRNPRELHHRQCMNTGCSNEFETTYTPERTEKVYCEECYLKSVG